MINCLYPIEGGEMGRKMKYEDIEQFNKLVNDYFNTCDKQNKPYTLSGLAYALDLDRKSLLNYSKNEKFFPTIKKAKEKIEQQLEENALMGKANATFTIFNLKNNYGWQDKTEVDVRKNPIEDLTPLAELLKGNNDKSSTNN